MGTLCKQQGRAPGRSGLCPEHSVRLQQGPCRLAGWPQYTPAPWSLLTCPGAALLGQVLPLGMGISRLAISVDGWKLAVALANNGVMVFDLDHGTAPGGLWQV